MGARLIIIDEVSLLGCGGLYSIDINCKKLLNAIYSSFNFSTTIHKNIILNNINTLPFGGLHVLFSGKLIKLFLN